MIQHEAVMCMYIHIKKGVCMCPFLCVGNRHRVVDISPGWHPQMEKSVYNVDLTTLLIFLQPEHTPVIFVLQ